MRCLEGSELVAGLAVLQNVPSISSTGLLVLSVCLYFPANCLGISYSCFMFPWTDASSASLARYSVKFALSVFTLFLTALFACVYTSCAVALYTGR